MSVLALKTPKQRRGPARDALAAAINETTGLHRTAKLAEAVVERARSLVDTAETRAKLATAAASDAKEGHAAAMLRSARTGDAVATTATTRELRHAEADALDDLAAARAALETAEAERDEATGARDRAGREVAVARSAVLAASIEPYIEDVRAGLEDLFRRTAALKFLGSLAGLPQEQSVRAKVFTENIRIAAQNSLGRHVELPVAEWELAAKALLSDPDAALPPVGGAS